MPATLPQRVAALVRKVLSDNKITKASLKRAGVPAMTIYNVTNGKNVSLVTLDRVITAAGYRVTGITLARVQAGPLAPEPPAKM